MILSVLPSCTDVKVFLKLKNGILSEAIFLPPVTFLNFPYYLSVVLA
jgi:hypothetical protein